MSNSHLFALHSPVLLTAQNGSVSIVDPDLYHRIINVLRLQVGERLHLFDVAKLFLLQIASVSKREVLATVVEVRTHKPLYPHIHWLLPILEREALEEALSHATVMGITSITPVITDRSQKNWRLKPDRVAKIMAAAAEQSKQFVFPVLEEPVHLVELSSRICADAPFLLFDDSGESLRNVLSEKVFSKTVDVQVISGPEGGLTEIEKELLQTMGARVCALTPTILRAWVAVSVGAGFLRTWFLSQAE